MNNTEKYMDNMEKKLQIILNNVKELQDKNESIMDWIKNFAEYLNMLDSEEYILKSEVSFKLVRLLNIMEGNKNE